MRVAVICLTALFMLAASAARSAGDDAAEEQVINGVLCKKTVRTVRRRVPETQYQEREVKVYRRENRTEYQEYQRNVLVPITEYRREMRWHGVWNPFVQPYLVEHQIPTTRWETHAETVKTPIVRSETIPETRTVKSPVVAYKDVEEQQVVWVPITGQRQSDPFANAGAPTVARRDRIGGVKKLDGDPPRKPNYDWRPAADGARLR